MVWRTCADSLAGRSRSVGNRPMWRRVYRALLLGEARRRLGPEAVAYCDHRRAAKRRALEIHSKRGAEKRKKRYRALAAADGADGRLRGVGARLGGAGSEAVGGEVAGGDGRDAGADGAVVEQTRRRVLDGETVPASEKIVSLFEPHTDIVVKSGRGTEYGHKVNPVDRAQRAGAGRGGGGRQPGRQHARPADAGAGGGVHGSWLNVAECELSAMTAQCLGPAAHQRPGSSARGTGRLVGRERPATGRGLALHRVGSALPAQAPVSQNYCLTEH